MNARVRLTENQIKFIELYIEGHKISDIAEKIGVSRQACYQYLDNEKIKTEVDTRLAEIKKQADTRIKHKLDIYISELEKIALTSDSEKIKSDNLQYLIDRVLGRATSKVADVTGKEEDNNIIDINDMLDQLDKAE
ncbi:MAG: helix-turn-helix domain-containing protein [Filifactoraceae bacterium]